MADALVVVQLNDTTPPVTENEAATATTELIGTQADCVDGGLREAGCYGAVDVLRGDATMECYCNRLRSRR